MGVMMTDALAKLSPEAQQAYQNGDLADLAYANDILLGVSAIHLTEYFATVAAAGADFGLEMHHNKFQLLQIGCEDLVSMPAGALTATSSMSYLGTTLSDNGRSGSELSRRIGAAKGDFAHCQKYGIIRF